MKNEMSMMLLIILLFGLLIIMYRRIIKLEKEKLSFLLIKDTVYNKCCKLYCSLYYRLYANKKSEDDLPKHIDDVIRLTNILVAQIPVSDDIKDMIGTLVDCKKHINDCKHTNQKTKNLLDRINTILKKYTL